MAVRLIKHVALPVVLVLAASGCSSSDESEATHKDEVAIGTSGEGDSIAPGVETKGAGTDPATPRLEPIGDEPDVDLGPTLGGCSFAYEGDVLFIAGAEDDAASRGRGIVQIAGVDRLMTGTKAGGPDMINAGPAMTDGEYTVVLRRSGGEGEPTGIESVRWSADLVVRKGAAAEKTYTPGTWTCGV